MPSENDGHLEDDRGETVELQPATARPAPKPVFHETITLGARTECREFVSSSTAVEAAVSAATASPNVLADWTTAGSTDLPLRPLELSRSLPEGDGRNAVAFFASRAIR
jgi:hypothetical protein